MKAIKITTSSKVSLPIPCVPTKVLSIVFHPGYFWSHVSKLRTPTKTTDSRPSQKAGDCQKQVQDANLGSFLRANRPNGRGAGSAVCLQDRERALRPCSQRPVHHDGRASLFGV